MKKEALRFLTLMAALAAALPAAGQSYPTRPVRVIVPYAPGGNTDLTARAIGAKVSEVFGQPILVENRPGAGTNIGTELVVRAPADGYTLLMGGASNAVNMTLFRKPPYDTLRDLAPVILCVQGANVLSVHPSLPAKNVRELIALAKAKPGALNFASSGIGSSNQMAGELFKLMADVKIMHVPYKGNTPALADAIAGHVEMIFSGVTSLVPLIKAGRLRAIAIGSLERFPSLPDVPTFDESGVKGYEATTWFGLMAPARTPREVITRWNTEVDRILSTKEMRDYFLKAGQQTKGGSAEDFTRYIRAEIEKYRKIILSAGIPRQ